jgi:hypothetical protein
MSRQSNNMKKIAGVFVAILILFGACGPKPYYLTNEGKKKQRFYNDIQYGRNDHPKKSW